MCVCVKTSGNDASFAAHKLDVNPTKVDSFFCLAHEANKQTSKQLGCRGNPDRSDSSVEIGP